MRFTFTNAQGQRETVDGPTTRKDIGKTINVLRKGSKNFDTIMRNGGR